MKNEQITKDHLVRIKLIYLRAVGNEGKNDDVSLIILVQTLDFVVECFLKLVGNTFVDKTVGKKKDFNRMNFADLWNAINIILGNPDRAFKMEYLPIEKDMARLRRLRNDVQHGLSIPHPKVANKYVPFVESFLKEGYEKIFGEDYEAISLTDLVTDEELRDRLKKVEERLNEGKWNEAVNQAAVSLYILIQLGKNYASIRPSKLSLHTAISRAFPDPMTVRGGSPRIPQASALPIKNVFEKVAEGLVNIQDHFAILACNIDYPSYLFYKPTLPEVWEGTSGFKTRGGHDSYSKREAEDIFSFVLMQVFNFQNPGV